MAINSPAFPRSIGPVFCAEPLERRQVLSGIAFGPPAAWGAGGHPYGVAAADFNGDGHTDLAVADENATGASLLLGNGSGGFAAPIAVAAGAATSDVAVGDFNGDGKPDLVITLDWGARPGEPHPVLVRLGHGDGTFAAAVRYVADSQPETVTVGDVNADGHADLVVANVLSDDVSVLLGDGTGVFAAAKNFAAGSVPTSVAIGDFNTDGHADLAVTDYDGTVSILVGNGGGGFSSPTPLAIPKDARKAITADLSGDGKLDLAVLTDGVYDNENNRVVTPPQLSIYEGNGSGGFTQAAVFSLNQISDGLDVADFDGDGRLDVACVKGASNVIVVTANGSGGFNDPVSFPARPDPTGMVVADFNGDGRPDLAVSNFGSNDASILLNTNPDEWAYNPAHPNFAGAPWPVPGVVRFQNYDVGGEGVAFHDTDKVNSYAVAVRGDGVDVSAKTNGLVGYVKAGEWLAFTVDVVKAGNYRLGVVAGDIAGVGGTFHVEDGSGNALTGEVGVPERNFFSGYRTINAGDIALPAGRHTLRFRFDSVGAGALVGDFLSFNTTYLNPVPVIGSLSASPNPVTVRTPVTLTANGVAETGGTVKSVSFLRESNGKAGLQTGASGDVFVAADNSPAGGWTATLNTAALSVGAYTLYAQATDAAGIDGPVVATSLSINPVGSGASVAGNVYRDADRDGTKDAGEANLPGVVVWIDLDGDKVIDAGEPKTTTDASGNYAFTNVAAAGSNAATRVRVQLPAGATQITPGNGYGYSVNLSAGATNTGKNFGLYMAAAANTASLSGFLFNDTDRDGVHDAGEAFTAGRQVWLDLDDDGVLDANEPQTTSGAQGQFTFANLAAGTYHVRRAFPAGYSESTPPRRITLTAGQAVTGVTIGSKTV